MFNRSRKLKGFFIFILLFCLPVTSALAASKLNLYNYGTKQNISYTGQQVKYYYNGTSIDMGGTPGLIIDGTAMASFSNVFVDSGINMSYQYNDSKGTITLKKDSNVLILTIGSKKGNLNGKSVTMSVAPMKVNYKDKNVTQVLVPTRFVTESFGYTYEWNSAASTVKITAPLKLSYNNKTVTYTGTKGNVTIDGKAVNLGTMPSIIIDNTALLRGYQVFAASSIKAGYKYNESTKILTLTKGDITVKLTVGSKTAIVNGKSSTMDAAPLYVTNLNTKQSYVMVPGSLVASYLGYDYTWNSTTKTSQITTRTNTGNSNSDGEDGPELGDDPAPDTISFDWSLASNFQDEYTKASSLTGATEIGTDESLTGYIDNIVKNSYADNRIEEYAIHSTNPISKSTATINNQILNVHISNSIINSTSYNLNGNLVTNVNATMDNSTITSDINFGLTYADTKYDIKLSDDRCTMYVTLYSNYLTDITAGTKSGQDFVQLTGMSALNVNVSETADTITLDLPNTVNALSDNLITTALTSLASVQLVTTGSNSTQIVISKSEDYTYSVTKTNNIYTITLVNGDSANNLDYSLQIKLPEDVGYYDIYNEDLYYKNQIEVIIPGDQDEFYEENPIATSNSVVKNISVTCDGQNTTILITTTKLQGYKLKDLNGSVGIALGNPKDIYENIVVLDAGHGGTDPGAHYKLNGKTINEKDVNFSIMYTLTQQYFNSDDSNIKVYYPRYNDTLIDLYARAAFAKKVGADLFVSLHMNANNSSTPNGTEVYYCSTNNSTNDTGINSKILGNMFLNSLPSAIGTTKRSVKSANYVVLRENTVPSVLIELGFMSNPSDLAKMTNAAFQDNAARAIYDTLCNVFETYPTGR
jgi:N-acetylmuramoyl-L-alanine amidase